MVAKFKVYSIDKKQFVIRFLSWFILSESTFLICGKFLINLRRVLSKNNFAYLLTFKAFATHVHAWSESIGPALVWLHFYDDLGAHVVSNHFTTCWDPVKYPEPEKFNPERFLDSEGKYCKPENYYWTPFGTGKRLAWQENFFQKYSIAVYCYL